MNVSGNTYGAAVAVLVVSTALVAAGGGWSRSPRRARRRIASRWTGAARLGAAELFSGCAADYDGCLEEVAA
ncbi:MAG: hypothetical protein ABJA98_07005 [Acidobacteriota bacterium]